MTRRAEEAERRGIWPLTVIPLSLLVSERMLEFVVLKRFPVRAVLEEQSGQREILEVESMQRSVALSGQDMALVDW